MMNVEKQLFSSSPTMQLKWQYGKLMQLHYNSYVVGKLVTKPIKEWVEVPIDTDE